MKHTVYVVTGYYYHEDRNVLAVFSTATAAHAYVKENDAIRGPYDYDGYDVEEFEVRE